MPITKRTRFEVLRRDSHRCRYCGAGLDDGARLTVDHVTPVALGGNEHTSESECEAFTEGEAAGEHDAWKVCFELHASLVLADDALVGIVDYGFDAYRLRSIDPWCSPELAPPAFAINHRHGQGVRMPKVA